MGTPKQNAAMRKARAAKKAKAARKLNGCGKKSKALVRRKKGLGDAGSAVKSVVATNKTAVKLAVGAAAGGLCFLIGRKIVKKIKEAKEGREFADAIAAIKVNMANTTIDETTAATKASRLLAAMNKWGTDENTIKKELDNLKTKDDYLLVYKAFKDKGYKNGKLNAEGRKMDLTGWLREELSGSDLKWFENKLQEWGVE
jgi:hypothetical protein